MTLYRFQKLCCQSDNEVLSYFPDRLLRAVAYRQFTRLVWGFTGSSQRYPLPCCAYAKIRKAHPDPRDIYKGFEEEAEDEPTEDEPTEETTNSE